MKRLILALLLLQGAPTVKAWTPCMPFCDNVCGGPALLTLGTTVAAEIGLLSAETFEANRRILAQYEGWTGTSEGALYKYALSHANGMVAFETAVWMNMQEQVMAESELLLDRDYGEAAYPSSMGFSHDAATRREAQYTSEAVAAKAYRNFMADLATKDDVARTKRISRLLDTTANGGFSVRCPDCEDDAQLISHLQAASSLVLGGGAGDISPTARIHAKAVDSLAASMIGEVLSTHTPSGDSSWASVFRDAEESETPTSSAFFLYEIPGMRLEGEGWIDLVYLNNETGLAREATYLTAEEVGLLEHRHRLSEMRALLISLLNITSSSQ